MNPSVARVARARIASEADALLDQLADLSVLDDTLTAIEDSFAMHYRTAAGGPTLAQVKSHDDALKKATAGLEQAQKIQAAARAIVEAFPEDKTAKRALADANTMVGRFTRHEAAARKIILTLAQKQMPPDLKAAASKLKAALSKLLVDPNQMQVTYWVQPHKAKIYSAHGHIYDTVVDTVLSSVVFRIEGIENAHQPTFQTGLRESPVGDLKIGVPLGVQVLQEGKWRTWWTNGSTEEVVEEMRRTLAGWGVLKGETDAYAARAAVADAVVRALDSAISRSGLVFDSKFSPAKVTHHDRGLVVDATYHAYMSPMLERNEGSLRYKERVREEIAKWRKVLDPYLAPHMKGIKDVIFEVDTTWVYTWIFLK